MKNMIKIIDNVNFSIYKMDVYEHPITKMQIKNLKNHELQINDWYPIENENLIVPKEIEIWEGRGYSGGHVSQDDWRDPICDSVFAKMVSLIKKGYYVIDKTRQGQTSGLYPAVGFWK